MLNKGNIAIPVKNDNCFVKNIITEENRINEGIGLHVSERDGALTQVVQSGHHINEKTARCEKRD